VYHCRACACIAGLVYHANLDRREQYTVDYVAFLSHAVQEGSDVRLRIVALALGVVALLTSHITAKGQSVVPASCSCWWATLSLRSSRL